MKQKEKYVFDPHGAHPHDAYAQFAKELGGTWDGQELKIKTDWCKIEGYSFEFLNEFIIAILGMESDRPIMTRHSSLSKEKTITIRLGLGATYKSNGTVKKFNNAGILILNSTQIHDFEFPAGEWSQWVSIRFSLNFFRKFAGDKKFKLKELFENDSPWINYYSQNAEIESRVRALIKNLDKENRKHTFFFTKAMEIVELLKGKIENDADKFKSNIHPEDLKLMLELRDTHLSDFTEIPNLTELSDKYGMSVSKLNRLFKSIFDKPILQFYNQQKLEEAHRQIVYTNKSLTEIAIDLNFSHVGHMSSSFKNHFGYAPSALKGKHMDYLS
ncbi:helix-turn-helix transcriptional regulator [Flammeovirga sp. MY04]|uniref:helix-turn-helix transcriptional regulator n=1 Tax=Flammeovirga sp. MY04 TaxID=1191459 RepID=UPI00080643BF|nr:helix-turn-helix transcriptional regulator [Flammeovirga sp. MY04]ANQ51170.1 helix-turn-helix transcriptional regulator [Flammeovirga sp. MY04]